MVEHTWQDSSSRPPQSDADPAVYIWAEHRAHWDTGVDLSNQFTPVAAAAVWMGWIHVFGGEIPGVFAQHEVYDPTARVWAMAAPMPVRPRSRSE